MRPHRPGRAPPPRAASRCPRRRAAATPPRARSGRLPARARRFVATGPPRTTRGVSIRSAIGTNPVKLELVSRRPARACRERAGGRARLPSAGPCDPPVQGGVGVMTEPRVSGADESARTVVVAVVANLLVAVAKGGAAALTGSAALAAETTHSIADTCNEVVLYIGVRRGARPPDDQHPFGYGQARYYWSLLSAVGILVIGGLVALADGIRSCGTPSRSRAFPSAWRSCSCPRRSEDGPGERRAGSCATRLRTATPT